MSRHRKEPSPHSGKPSTIAAMLASGDSSLLDLVDNVVNKGIVLNGDILLGVADVDLIYLRLSAVLCAADRIFGTENAAPRSRGMTPDASREKHGKPQPASLIPALGAPALGRPAQKAPRAIPRGAAPRRPPAAGPTRTPRSGIPRPRRAKKARE